MSKYHYSSNTIYYQKARFFRKNGTNEFAYCIQPFEFFKDGTVYETVINPNNLNSTQKERISRIAHFGYGYKNHTDVKWYAITQFMIWETADYASGKFYFTDSLNGNKINPYQNEIDEINYLVNTYDNIPIPNNKKYTIREGSDLEINAGEVIKYYSSDNSNIIIDNQKIKIKDLKEGEYTFNLYRNDNNYNKPIIFYQSNNSQNLVDTGNINDKKVTFIVKVVKTEITINKLDDDNKDIIPQGEASLDGAIVVIYNDKNEEINKLTIKDNQAIINNIDFGTYYIKEELPGEGYTKNEEVHKITIDEKNPTQMLNIYNKVIKKNIKIIKKYGEGDNFNSEKNIDFEIYDKNNKLINTISTNKYGEAMITLPYGKYKFIQKNTTKGYQIVAPFDINVDNNDDEIIELKDLRIPVPNTYSERKIDISTIIKIISFILFLW